LSETKQYLNYKYIDRLCELWLLLFLCILCYSWQRVSVIL